ncbi:MAG: DUF1570 domain-containing protein [Planctomycetes bacterium]|nr:DUF1570 domain-containing protein [Planctomycetota bacterium]
MNKLGILALALLCGAIAYSSEKVSIDAGGKKVRGDVVSVTDKEVVLKVQGENVPFPAVLLDKKDIFRCRQQLRDPNNAKGRFELGKWAWEKGLKAEAEEEMKFAVLLDAATYQPLVNEVTGAAPAAQTAPAETPATANAAGPENPGETAAERAFREATQKGKEGEKNTAGPAKTEEPEKPKDTEDPEGDGNREGPTIKIKINGQWVEVPAKFASSKEDIKPRSEEEMKKFLDERLEECKKTIGGDWRLIETKHYYCLANIDPALHQEFANHNEKLYDLLCDVMKHKEGDPLWNNKCPIYYFATFKQFQRFAVTIDAGQGSPNSGGYFSHRGREVHVCIPFYNTKGDKAAYRDAFNTLFHEGTHAFLQLSGKDVMLPRWLHEGLAQFIEFWFDPKNNPGRNDRIYWLRRMVTEDDVPMWAETRMRPAGGTDSIGYALAWSKLEFLYRSFPTDRTKLPQFIKTFKESMGEDPEKIGELEDKAMQKVYGKTEAQMETVYHEWLKRAVKANFKF